MSQPYSPERCADLAIKPWGEWTAEERDHTDDLTIDQWYGVPARPDGWHPWDY